MAFPSSPVPNEIHEEATEYRVTQKRALDGTRHTRYHGQGEERKWRLVYSQLSASDQAILDAYYDTNKGAYLTDTWTHPWDTGIGTVNVYIADFKRDRGAYPLRSYSVVLQEVP